MVSFASGTVARICSMAASPLARLRIAITTSAPAAASRVASPRPRPELDAGDDGQLSGQIGDGDGELRAWSARITKP